MKTYMAAMRTKRILDVGQIPYNQWQKATLMYTSLYDYETIHLVLCINVMNIVLQHESG